MKQKLILIFIAPFFISCSAVSQKIIINGEETNRNLTWSDFTGEIDKSSSYFAYTGFLINQKAYNIKAFGDSISIGKFEVTVTLDPKKSWVNMDKVTDYLLLHEQGHFNIGILCMREILAVYAQTKFTKSNINTAIQNIVSEAIKKYTEMSVKYDEESEHSKNLEQQEKWNTFFLEKLAQ